MKRKITQLAKGIIDAKIPEIRVLTESVDAKVLCGQQSRGELSLSSGTACIISSGSHCSGKSSV